jgi:outer membrane putative beta-barrel porin/alpha-amylase
MNRALPILLSLVAASLAHAQNADEMAKQVANPIASLTSVPVQFNDEYDAGVNGDGHRLRINVQPVIPISIGADWNLISRTIVPIVRQEDMAPGAGRQSGIGDTTQSLFFSPKALTAGGWTWGVGPVFLLPTASDDALGTERWGAGPTFVALRQTASGWTYGALANHIASLAGNEQRAHVNATFLQPFVAKRVGPGRTVSLNVESTYDWERDAWTAPLNVGISQILPIGKQLVSLQAGGAYSMEAPSGTPEWGARLTVTFLYPKH